MDGALVLRIRYNSSDKRSLKLAKWQGMRVSDEMSKNPERSQMEVFVDSIDDLGSLQKQLDTIYHGDRYFRDQILHAVYLPAIQIALRDRVPHTSEQAINRVANGLSDN